jgi:hypothetical protein
MERQLSATLVSLAGYTMATHVMSHANVVIIASGACKPRIEPGLSKEGDDHSFLWKSLV